MGQKEFEQYAINEGLNTFDDEELDRQYANWLDEVNGDVVICGMSYYASTALEKLDPIAYRCGYTDWLDSVRDTYTELDNGDYCLTDELEGYRDAWEAIEQRAEEEADV